MNYKYYIFYFLINFYACHKKVEPIKKYVYSSAEQKYSASTILDTSAFFGNFFQHFPSYTSIVEYDTSQNIGYKITWGNIKPNLDWSPFTYFSYDVSWAKNKLLTSFDNKPIYFVNLNIINNRKFISACVEQNGMGILILSYFYSDTLNILIQTTYINEFDFSKIEIKKHFDILENTDIIKRD